jgi:stress response protein YsnF
MPAKQPRTVLPLIEEKLRVEKTQKEVGRVRVSVSTQTVEEVVRETLRSRNAEVRRVPVGQEIGQAPAIREENGVLIIPVVEEVLVVVKKLFLKEEVHVYFEEKDEIVEQSVERRVQHAVVERLASDEPDRPGEPGPGGPYHPEEF